MVYLDCIVDHLLGGNGYDNPKQSKEKYLVKIIVQRYFYHTFQRRYSKIRNLVSKSKLPIWVILPQGPS